MSLTLGQPMVKNVKVTQSSVFNDYLLANGATKEDVKRIKELINQLVARSQIKQEDMSDKVGLLKKVEI